MTGFEGVGWALEASGWGLMPSRCDRLIAHPLSGQRVESVRVFYSGLRSGLVGIVPF